MRITMRYVVPFKKDALPSELSYLDSFKQKMLAHNDDTRLAYLAIESDEKVDMELAYMGLFAFVHGKSHPETHDFFFGIDSNQFRHERNREFYTAYAPKADDSIEVIGTIQHQDIVKYSHDLLLAEIKERKYF